MAEETKKRFRSITDDTKSTGELRFHEKDSINGLFSGHLKEVKCEWSVPAQGKSFAGLKYPRLVFHFASNDAPSEQRHYYFSVLPVESSVDTFPEGKNAFRVDQVFAWIKYMLQVFYLEGRSIADAGIQKYLYLPFEDIDEEGQYVQVDPQDVLNGYGFLFTNVAEIMEGRINLADGETPKPCYKTADGKYKRVWMKLLRYKKKKNNWEEVANNGELAFDPSILSGSGCLELQKPGVPTAKTLRIDTSKESIIPQKTNKEPNYNRADLDGGITVGSNGEYAGGDDLPFGNVPY